VYDARLVVFTSVYAIRGIVTFNDADFKRYDSITAIHPSSAVALRKLRFALRLEESGAV
jgi:hypothetical protein